MENKHNHIYDGVVMELNCKECDRIRDWQFKYLSVPFIIFTLLLMFVILKSKLL